MDAPVSAKLVSCRMELVSINNLTLIRKPTKLMRFAGVVFPTLCTYPLAVPLSRLLLPILGTAVLATCGAMPPRFRVALFNVVLCCAVPYVAILAYVLSQNKLAIVRFCRGLCVLLCRLSAAGDMGLMADLMKDLEDPETRKEVEKLMKVRAIVHGAGGLSYGYALSILVVSVSHTCQDKTTIRSH